MKPKIVPYESKQQNQDLPRLKDSEVVKTKIKDLVHPEKVKIF